ncbi:MAG: hypothetical protein J5I81_02460 [Nitrococcus mobilis]|nr:hypothetical protein [Nitrococcus mobilis]
MNDSVPSSAVCGAVLVVDVVPSRRLFGLVLALYAAAALPALLWSDLAVAVRIGWFVVIVALCYRELIRQGWARPSTFVHRFGRTGAGHWFFEACGVRYGEAVLTDRLVGPGVCVLRLSTPRFTRTLVVPTDATDEVSHRRLRAMLLAPQ